MISFLTRLLARFDTFRILHWVRELHLPTRLACLMVLWSLAVGYLYAQWQATSARPLRPIELAGQWIATAGDPTYAGYFRTSVTLTAGIKHAWVAVSAESAFEMTVNGNPVGGLSLWRPTRPFQNGLSEANQWLGGGKQPALGLNFPREYQWADHDNAKLPVWIDLSRYLKLGRNVITVQIEARGLRPSFQLEGAIELWSGQTVPLGSSIDWRAEPVPPGIADLDWTHPHYDDSHWRHAAAAIPRSATQYCGFDQRIYTLPFAGNWLSTNQAASTSPCTFLGAWELAEQPGEANLRVLANRRFEIYLNGQQLKAATTTPANLDNGNWVVNDGSAWDAFRVPELVDPDEVGSVFVGHEFMNPRHADPTYDAVRTYRKQQQNVTSDKPNSTNRSDLPGTYDPVRELSETRHAPANPPSYPDQVPPRSTSHDRGPLAYYGYDISGLLHVGSNSIEIRLLEPGSTTPLNWSARVALDAHATAESGAEAVFISDSRWKSIPQPAVSGGGLPEAVQCLGQALTSQRALPSITFRGIQRPEDHFATAWASAALLTFVITVWFLAGGKLLLLSIGNFFGDLSSSWIRYWSRTLLISTAFLVCLILVQVSYVERDERLWFLQPETFVWAGWATAIALAASAGHLLWKTLKHASFRGPALPSLGQFLRHVPATRGWKIMILVLLLIGLMARVYKLDLQPLDDDEYASVQGVLSIAKTGAPGFVPNGVYYSRSPGYHYLAAAFVYVFGENLWALRIPSALFGIGTAWLTYLMGVTLLRSRWVGLGAMVLILFHPYEIFTSHVARFYQQQQFFALLSMYWFCLGFVTNQSQIYRYLAVLATLITIVSQEIAIVMIPQFLVAFVLFARDLGWRNNVRLLLAACIAGVWILLDWVAFQTLCLTRLEGVSPNLEATIKPHFWQPFNLFSIFIGYSRLHVTLSAFLALDLFFGWRSRHRAFLALFTLQIAGVVMANLLVTHSSLRYQYFLFPTWALLGMEALRRTVARLPVLFSIISASRSRQSIMQPVLATLFFATIVVSWSPWRVLGSYDIKILPDSTGACRFVAQQARPEDKIMITEPHPHAAFLEIGRVDYDLTMPLLHDFVMLDKGVLIDRNAGARVVESLERLQSVLKDNDRVWIIINKEKLRSRGKNLRWEYPAARVEDFLRQNAELKFRSPLWYVYLWDASAGHQRLYRNTD